MISPEVKIFDRERDVVDKGIYDKTPRLHLPSVGSLDEGLYVVGRPPAKLNRLLVIKCLA